MVPVLASAQAPTLTVLSREGRKPLPITTINNQEYVAVDDINATFGTTSREDRLAGGLTITARGQSIVLTADQNVVSVAGRLVSLPAPTAAPRQSLVGARGIPAARAVVGHQHAARSAALDAAADRRRDARAAHRGPRRRGIDQRGRDLRGHAEHRSARHRAGRPADRAVRSGCPRAERPADSPADVPHRHHSWRHTVNDSSEPRAAHRHASRHHVAGRCGVGTSDDRSAAGHDRSRADAGALSRAGHAARDSHAGPVHGPAHGGDRSRSWRRGARDARHQGHARKGDHARGGAPVAHADRKPPRPQGVPHA